MDGNKETCMDGWMHGLANVGKKGGAVGGGGGRWGVGGGKIADEWMDGCLNGLIVN